jgi:hypothetical protein
LWQSQGGAKDSLPNRLPRMLRRTTICFCSIERHFIHSPRSADDSSRLSERKVEFVNHPKAVF